MKKWRRQFWGQESYQLWKEQGSGGVSKRRQRLGPLPQTASSPQPGEGRARERERGSGYYGGEEARPRDSTENLKQGDPRAAEAETVSWSLGVPKRERVTGTEVSLSEPPIKSAFAEKAGRRTVDLRRNPD